jgi:predicted negative regulator of RcsB-dependent stress response
LKALRYKTGKKKLKLNEPDEFQSLTQKAMDYIKENSKQAYIVLGAIAVVVVAVVLFGIWKDTDRKNAMYQEAEALRYYDINSAVPGGKPMGSLDRYKKSKELFEQIVKSHGGAAADIARYYEANSEMEMGNVDPAIAGYTEVISKSASNQVLVSLATMRLAEAYVAKGDKQKAIDTLHNMIKAEKGYMKDAALYMVAKVYESNGSAEDAKRAYEKLVKDYPDSPYTRELMPAQAAAQPATMTPVAQGTETTQPTKPAAAQPAQPLKPVQPAPAQKK